MPETQRSLITSRSEFHAAVRTAISQAATVGCREIWIADDDFGDWPLNEPALVEDLTRWSMSHRRFHVLARDFDTIARKHARWVQWRRQWSHVVNCYTNSELEAGQMPCLLLAPGSLSLRLFDPVHYRGVLTDETADALVWREAVDAAMQRSQEAFPATTLGL
jgi:hypothetical protein